MQNRRAMFLARRSRAARDLVSWEESGFSPPAPQLVKRATLARWGIPAAPWVETGTLHGTMTEWLAKRYLQVISIEPEPELHASAARRLAALDNVTLICGTSEDCLESAISHVSGHQASFWLDGHYSQGPTYAGIRDTPVLIELKAIQGALESGRLEKVAVLIDDVRLFVSRHTEMPQEEGREGYPSLTSLVEWADAVGLQWSIENDIFCATNLSRRAAVVD